MKQWMKGRGGVGLAVILSASAVVPAMAQFGSGGTFPGGAGGGPVGGGMGFGGTGFGRQSARENVKFLEGEIRLLREKLNIAKARYTAGQTPAGEVQAAELELNRVERQLVDAHAEANREQRLQELNRFIDVDLQGATVRQAAQALGKASGVRIEVDEKIPNDARLTVKGRGVPMSVLLDRVGSRANLMIVPSEDGKGVELKSWPALELDGEKTIYKGPLAPWSTEWGAIPITGAYRSEAAPAMGAPGAGMAPGGTGGGGAPSRPGGGRTSSTKTPAGSSMTSIGGSGIPGMPGMSGMSGMPGMSPGMMPGMSSGTSAASSTSIGVGNGSIVVAEPGVKDGHAGLWLTVYKLSGTSLLKIGTGFHRSGGAASGGKSGQGMPGMGAPGGMGGFAGGLGGPSGSGGGFSGGFGLEGGFGNAFGSEGGGSGGAPGRFGGTGGGSGVAPGGFGSAGGAPMAPPRPRAGKPAPGARPKTPAKPAPAPKQ